MRTPLPASIAGQGKGRASAGGFTLVQVSVILMVAALVMVATLPSSQTNLTNANATTTRMNAILTALRSYEVAHGDLPCPADASLPIGSANYGVAAANSNCAGGTPAANYTDATNNVAIGMVPVRTLGLSNDYALDSFGRDITYAADTSATSACWSSSSLTGNIVVTDNGTTNNTVVALVSHGPDGHGAWLPLPGSSGTAARLNAGITDTDTHLVNAHGSSGGTFPANYASINSLVASEEGTTTTFVRKPPVAGAFDDIVVYKNSNWSLNTQTAAVQNSPITVTPPANGTYTPSQPVTFTLTFVSAVTVTGTPRLDLSALSGGSIGTGNVAYATYQSGSGTNTLTFTYTPGASDNAPNGISVSAPIDLNGGTLSSPPTLCFTPLVLSGVIISNNAVSIVSETVPANGTYVSGNVLTFTVTWNAAVTVTGTPRLDLSALSGGGIGTSNAAYATYKSGSGTATLTFKYTVQKTDLALSGIAMASPVDLNGGTIENSGTNVALTYTPPSLAAVIIPDQIVSNAGPGMNDYATGQTLTFTVTYEAAVTVTGTPRLDLTIGSNTRYATYKSGSGTKTLTFSYTIVSGDLATTSISAASPIDLNGGTIMDGTSAAYNVFSMNLSGVDVNAPPVIEWIHVSSNLNVSACEATNLAPAASYASVNPGYYCTSGYVLTLEVDYSQVVTVTGSPYLNLTGFTSGTHQATYSGGEGSSTLNFTYTVQATDDACGVIGVSSPVVLNGGTITTNGINATETFTMSGGVTDINGNPFGIVTTWPTSATTPTGPSYTTGQTPSFVLHYNKAVTAGSPTPYLQFQTESLDNIESNPQFSYASGSGTTALTLSHTVTSQDNGYLENTDWNPAGALPITGTIQDSNGCDQAPLQYTPASPPFPTYNPGTGPTLYR